MHGLDQKPSRLRPLSPEQPAHLTSDVEGRIVKDGVGKIVKDRQLALDELVEAIREFRKFTDQRSQSLFRLICRTSNESVFDSFLGKRGSFKLAQWRAHLSVESRVAAIISVVETCRRLKIPVRDYPCSVLPGLDNFPVNQIGELTPVAWVTRN